MVTNRFYSKTKLAAGSQEQLLGYIAWQWDKYLVPQNVFLVLHVVSHKDTMSIQL